MRFGRRVLVALAAGSMVSAPIAAQAAEGSAVIARESVKLDDAEGVAGFGSVALPFLMLFAIAIIVIAISDNDSGSRPTSP